MRTVRYTAVHKFSATFKYWESMDGQPGFSSSQEKYTDGTYTGSGQGYRGTTTVEVTVSGGNITDITVISYADDDEFFNKAKNSVRKLP